MVVCHSPLGEKQLVDRFKEKFILVDGCVGDPIKLALYHGYKKPISVFELIAIYPELVYAGSRLFEKQPREEIIKRVSQRVGIPVEKLAKKLYFSAIMMFNPPENPGLSIQVFNDLIGS